MKLFLFTLLVASSLFAADTAPAPSPLRLPNAFGAYNLETFNRPALEQVRLLSSLGYDGIVACTWGKDSLAQVGEFLDVPAIREGKFAVYGVLWTPNLDQGFDEAWLAKLIPLTAKLHAPLWVAVFGDRKKHERTVTMLQSLADQCAANGVPLVLYPHYGSTFVDLDEGLALLTELKRPAVKLSIHLCHELMAGNEKRMTEVIDKFAPYLALASLNGADTAGNFREDWVPKLIKPLNEGPYDVHPYVAELVRHGYRGPFLQHTYGFKTPPEEYFASSIKRWREISADVAAQLAAEASAPKPAPSP